MSRNHSCYYHEMKVIFKEPLEQCEKAPYRGQGGGGPGHEQPEGEVVGAGEHGDQEEEQLHSPQLDLNSKYSTAASNLVLV